MNEQKEKIPAGKPEKNYFLVVGIGASAGGVEALQQFFENVPADSDMAYVVILHLSPDYDSQLAAILGRIAPIPVTQVTEKVQIAPNQVYVVPPNQHLTMEDGSIAVLPNLFVEDRRAPVDIFFRTLGEVYHSRSVGVILSGTGANGSMGIKRIKERGGAAFVQNPREALFNEMPRNAITTDLVDGILPVADIPAKIIAYKESLGTVHIAEKNSERPEDQQHALREIFMQLRMRTGHDFSNYKRPTLLRRIERRINVHNLNSLTAYATFLQQHPDEAVALLKDLLISVTNFFRDRKAFEYIETDILSNIFVNKVLGSAVRIWVIGCATGEEAYSLAILCAEHTMKQPDAPKVQIFATDIDETAIAAAREGIYTLNDAADVSPERLRRFFTKEGESYRIRREIREMVLFATHNVLKDPPFSHLDIVSCRNMLIYLNHTAQERVMETVHFALEPGGYLFLGTSESTDGASDLYTIVSREHHVYQSRAVAPRSFPVPESVPAYLNNTNNKVQAELSHEGESRSLTRFNYADLHQRLLEQYAPPSIVVNEEYDIVHLTERASKYLQIAGGEISKNILKLIRTELRLELRTALYQSVQRRTTVEARDIKVRVDDGNETINIHVRPVLREDDTNRGFLLVLFEKSTGPQEEEKVIYTSDEPMARHLEEELVHMKTRLRSTIEQHELQAEELKASNEELQAMNEELRSAAEELETSKEELQSINEELTTVNQELKVKIEETTISSNNFQNLINSTDIATIFLDRSLRINMFTPPARELFNVIPADIGRPLSDITNQLTYTGLPDDAEQVLEKLQMIEKEVRTSNGSFYLMRILPYRTEEDRINGVVVTFINVTERQKAEEALRKKEAEYLVQLEQEVAQRTAELKESKDLLQATMDSSMEMIQVFEAVRNDNGDIIDFKWILNNHSSEKYYGNVIGQSLLQNNPGVVEEGIFDAFKKVVETGIPNQSERHYVHEQFAGWFYQSTVKLGDGVATTTTDITERKKAEQEVQTTKERLQAILDSSLYTIQAFQAVRDETGKITDFIWVMNNQAAIEQNGNVIGKSLLQQNPGVLSSGLFNKFVEVTESGIPIDQEQYYNYGQFDGWFHLTVVKMGDGFVLNTENITERKNAQEEILRLKDEIAQQATDKYYSLFNSIDEGFCIIQMIYNEHNEPVDYRFLEANPLFEKQTGLRDAVGKTMKELVPTHEEHWFRMFEEVTKERAPKRFEQQAENLLDGVWYEVYAFPYGKPEEVQVAILFNDITARKQEEQRQQLLLQLSDALRPLSNAVEIQEVVTRITMNHFGADRCYYGEIEEDTAVIRRDASRGDLPSVMATYPLSSVTIFKTVLETGRPLIVQDSNTTPLTDDVLKDLCIQMQILAYINVPVIKNGKPAGVLCITQCTPRNWTAVEVSLAEEIAERTWAAVEKVKAEEALRASENRFRTVTDAVPQVIWANNAQGKANYFNKRWYEYSGLSYEESAGGGWQAIVHPDDAPASVEEWNKALAAGEVFDTEYRLRRADGVYRWHIGRNVPLRDENGKILGWFGSATDIEDLTEVQASLRESEERNRAMVNQTSVGIVRADVNGALTFLNEKARLMFGFGAEEGTGKVVWELVTRDDVEENKRLYKRLFDEGLPFQYEKRLRRNGKNESGNNFFWASVSVAPIKGAEGKTQSAVAVIVDVTGRKQAEEALHETMERFQYAVQATKDVIWEIDFHRNHVWWSSLIHTLFGYSQYDVKHTIDWFHGLVHPEDRQRVAISYRRVLESREELWTDEFRYQQASGNYVYVICRSFIIRDKEGKAARMIGAMQDVTERRQAEEAVRKSEERLRATLESAGDYVIITQNTKGIIESWNSGAERIFGYAAAEVTGKYGNFFYTPEDQAAGVPEQEMATARTEGRAADERWHLRKEGIRIFLSGVMAPIRNNNIITGFVKVARDMTAQKQAEEALLTVQNSLTTALEAAKMGVWDMNIATGVVTRSAQHDQLLGYPTLQEEWSFDKAKRYLAEEDKPRFDEAFRNMISEGKFELEARVHHPNGSICWIHYYGRVFKNDKGEPSHAAGVIFDISDRKSVEQKKDEFIGIASHELKTPVTSIKAYTEILYDQFVEAGDKEYAIYLKKLNNQVDRLTHLIRDLLDATRISEGRLALNETSIDINQLLHNTTDELQSIAGKHTIELNLQDIPTIQGDIERLQQVFVNLIANAIKYSPEANRVIVKTYQDNGNINIAVQDFGIGMSPETQSKLFERFFRSSDQNITIFPGLGLGLYISLQIVKQHKGTIKVQSEIGKGSIFTVVLPVKE